MDRDETWYGYSVYLGITFRLLCFSKNGNKYYNLKVVKRFTAKMSHPSLKVGSDIDHINVNVADRCAFGASRVGHFSSYPQLEKLPSYSIVFAQ